LHRGGKIKGGSILRDRSFTSSHTSSGWM